MQVAVDHRREPGAEIYAVAAAATNHGGAR
jgi:hypothetical protein